MAYGERKPFITNKGYVRVYAPEHDLANRWGHVLQHRQVAWNHGIITDPLQVVHHINGVKTDNRPENLQAMAHGEHTSHHGQLQPKRTRAEYLAAEKERYRRRTEQHTCQACGRTYGGTSGSCSNRCSAVLRRQGGWRPAYMHDCEICGREFRSRAGDGRFCGASCRSKANRQIARAVLAYGNDPCTVGMS